MIWRVNAESPLLNINLSQIYKTLTTLQYYNLFFLNKTFIMLNFISWNLSNIVTN